MNSSLIIFSIKFFCKTFNSKVPYKQNTGFMFVPGKDTWHRVPKQYIFGVRRNLIINYVSSNWKSTSELYKMN